MTPKEKFQEYQRLCKEDPEQAKIFFTENEADIQSVSFNLRLAIMGEIEVQFEQYERIVAPVKDSERFPLLVTFMKDALENELKKMKK